MLSALHWVFPYKLYNNPCFVAEQPQINWNLILKRIVMIFGFLLILMREPKSQTRGQSMQCQHLSVNIHCGYGVKISNIKA